MIDLHNDGIDLLRPEDSRVLMDVDGDGQRERVGWAAPSDAVLVLDANRDGRVDVEREVSFVSHLPGARTDLEGLAAHDSDGDGAITAADARWQDFGLFQDRNGNGLQEDGELISLDDAGLRSLSLVREGSPEMNQGNFVFGTSAVQWTDGTSSRAGDVMFAVQSTSLNRPLSADEFDAEIERMALRFNQIAALPNPTEHDALTAFVPSATQSFAEDWVAAAHAHTLSSGFSDNL